LVKPISDLAIEECAELMLYMLNAETLTGANFVLDAGRVLTGAQEFQVGK
jgi:hypothetical protein